MGADDLDTDAAAVQRSITPQAVGWAVLAGLIALAGLAVVGQAAARQFSTDTADHDALAAMGLRAREFVLLGLARAFLIGLAGAAGAVALTAALSPLTPVGEARLATAHPGAVTLDPLVTLIGVPSVLAALVLLSVWPAIRHARSGPAGTGAATGRAGPIRGPRRGRDGAPASVLIGVRYALERGRGRTPVPVGTALLGTVLAVTALAATTVFGASLTRLLNSPALYGAPFQLYIPTDAGGTNAALENKLLSSLRRDRAIDRITLAAGAEIDVNGRSVRTAAFSPARGPALLSAVDGRLPQGDRDIALGAATLRGLGAQAGDQVRVTVHDPVTGAARTSRFRVSGRAAFAPSFGTGGFGNGAALTVSGLLHAQCPAGGSACLQKAQQGLVYSVLLHAAPGPVRDGRAGPLRSPVRRLPGRRRDSRPS